MNHLKLLLLSVISSIAFHGCSSDSKPKQFAQDLDEQFAGIECAGTTKGEILTPERSRHFNLEERHIFQFQKCLDDAVTGDTYAINTLADVFGFILPPEKMGEMYNLKKNHRIMRSSAKPELLTEELIGEMTRTEFGGKTLRPWFEEISAGKIVPRVGWLNHGIHRSQSSISRHGLRTTFLHHENMNLIVGNLLISDQFEDIHGKIYKAEAGNKLISVSVDLSLNPENTNNVDELSLKNPVTAEILSFHYRNHLGKNQNYKSWLYQKPIRVASAPYEQRVKWDQQAEIDTIEAGHNKYSPLTTASESRVRRLNFEDVSESYTPTKLDRNTSYTDVFIFEVPAFFDNNSYFFLNVNDKIYPYRLNFIHSHGLDKHLGGDLKVPSDPKAKYTILHKVKMNNGNWNVTTERIGSSGTSYAQREVDCENNQQRYLADADTSWGLVHNDYSIGPMTEPMKKSISGVMQDKICGSDVGDGGYGAPFRKTKIDHLLGIKKMSFKDCWDDMERLQAIVKGKIDISVSTDTILMLTISKQNSYQELLCYAGIRDIGNPIYTR